MGQMRDTPRPPGHLSAALAPTPGDGIAGSCGDSVTSSVRLGSFFKIRTAGQGGGSIILIAHIQELRLSKRELKPTFGFLEVETRGACSGVCGRRFQRGRVPGRQEVLSLLAGSVSAYCELFRMLCSPSPQYASCPKVPRWGLP